MNIDDMAEDAYDNACDKGWHDEPRSVGDLIALCHSELSEALEAYRTVGTARWYEESKPNGFLSELADTVIRIGDMVELLRKGGMLDQSLGTAIAEKMAFNKTRPYRHGGKRL